MGGVNKILLPLGDRLVIGVTMLAFEKCESVKEIVIVAREADIPAIKAEAEAAGITKLIACTTGGATRQESVINGIKMISKEADIRTIFRYVNMFPKTIDAVASGGNAMGSALIPALDAMGVATLVVIIVVGTFGAFYLFLNGISMVGAVQGSQLGAIEPVSATVCSAVLMGTAFSIPDWIGLALMVCTIILVAAGGASRESENT